MFHSFFYCCHRVFQSTPCFFLNLPPSPVPSNSFAQFLQTQLILCQSVIVLISRYSSSCCCCYSCRVQRLIERCLCTKCKPKRRLFFTPIAAAVVCVCVWIFRKHFKFSMPLYILFRFLRLLLAGWPFVLVWSSCVFFSSLLENRDQIIANM